MVENNQPSRRAVIGKAASEIALIATSGSAYGKKNKEEREYVGGLEELNRDFKRTVQKRGDPHFVDFWSVFDGETKKDTSDPSIKSSSVLSENGYDNGVVEKVRFEDGTEKTVESVRSNNIVKAYFNGGEYRVKNPDTLEKYLHRQASKQKMENPNQTQSVEVQAAGGKKNIDIGDDTYITSANDGNTKDPGFSGIVKKNTKYETDENEAGAALQVAYAADATVHAEVYQDVRFNGPTGKHQLRLTGGIGYRGSSGSALSGGSIEGVGFIRPKDESGEEETIDVIDVDLGLVDGWGEANYVNEDTLVEVERGTHEVGVRIELSAMAAGPSSSIIDFYHDVKSWMEINGYFNYDHFQLEWV